MHLVFYWTDFLVWLFFAFSLLLFWVKRTSPLLHQIKATLVHKPRYIVALVVLTSFTVIGLLDSIHFTAYDARQDVRITRSVLDQILAPRDIDREKTYSSPFALQSFVAEVTSDASGKTTEITPPLKYAGQSLTSNNQKTLDIFLRVSVGFVLGVLIWGLLYATFHRRFGKSMTIEVKRSFWLAILVMVCWVTLSAALMFEYHVLGTDKIGRDVYYMAIKSIRTGLVIGTVTTFAMLPFALSMGIWAGYFRGYVDDIIQYLYTTLGSIPGVLLIAAAVISFQSRIEENPDLKLLLLCLVLGATGWIGLCRLLRGETLKLRETDYVQAAKVLGVSDMKILLKHILPNLMHIVIITVVLDFSGLVLAESVLSYIGVGVSASTYSWGNMINAALLEMAREPMVWWSLVAAFIFMFTLVFAANIFGDAIQQALNPKER